MARARPTALERRRRATAAVIARANRTGFSFGTGIHSISRVHWRPGSRVRARRAGDILPRFRLDRLNPCARRAERAAHGVFRRRRPSARRWTVPIVRSLSIFKFQASFEAGSLLTRFGVSRRRRPRAIGIAPDRTGRVCRFGQQGSRTPFPRGWRRSRGVTGALSRGPSRAKILR